MRVLHPAVRRVVVRGPRTVARFAQHTLSGTDGTMYDSVTWQSMPRAAGVAYAGYVDGIYANWSTIVAQFPGHNLLSITVSGANFARCCDVETGDLTNSQIQGFLTRYASQFTQPPVVYTSAGNMAAVQRLMASLGYQQGTDYFMWSAHYIGYHLCGPGTCGYGIADADATQYSTGSYDSSVVTAGFFAVPSAPPPVNTDSVIGLGVNDMSVIIPPQPAGAPVIATGVSFDGSPYTTIGLLADASLVGGIVTVRAAFHIHSSNSFSVQTVTLSASAPKVVLQVPAGADGVSFTRLDDLPAELVPNFA